MVPFHISFRLSQDWPRSGLNAKTLARILVRMENGANHIWKFSGNPRRDGVSM